MSEEHTRLPWKSLHQYIFGGGGGPLPIGAGYHDSVVSPGGEYYRQAEINAAFIVRSVNGAEFVRSIWEDQRIRINVHKDYPELAEAIDKLVGPQS